MYTAEYNQLMLLKRSVVYTVYPYRRKQLGGGGGGGGGGERSGNKANEVHLTALSYGYATNTRVKFIIVTENATSQSRDTDIKMVSNYKVDSELDTDT